MAFKVYNPAAGRWFILHWWTEHDRGHVSFAKDEADLLAVAKKVADGEPYATCMGAFEIEMVGPSDKIERLAAMHDRREAVDHFYFQIAQRVKDVLEAGRPLPGPFEECKNFETENEEDQKEEWAGERHYSCKNCDMRLKLVDMSRDELYTRYSERWYALYPPYVAKPSKKYPVATESFAPTAGDDEKIWYAYGNFGDHAGGVELHEVDLSDAEEYRTPELRNQVLFFYRPIRIVSLAEINNIFATAAAASEAASETKEEDRKKERAGENERDIQATIEFFKEAP